MPLIAAYDFDEGTGASVADVSGNGYELTRGANGTWVEGYHGGFAIRSRPQHIGEIAGSGAYGAFPGGPPDGSSLTFLFWAKAPTMPDGWSALLGVLNDWDGHVFGITVDSDGRLEADWQSDTGDFAPAATMITPGVVALDEWVHIAGVFHPGVGATLYANGVVVTTYNWQAGSSAFKVFWTTLLVGSYKWGSGGACIDDLRIYNEVLSQAQIVTLMNTPVTTRSGKVKVWDGTDWSAHPLKVWDGSAWVTRKTAGYNGTDFMYGKG